MIMMYQCLVCLLCVRINKNTYQKYEKLYTLAFSHIIDKHCHKFLYLHLEPFDLGPVFLESIRLTTIVQYGGHLLLNCAQTKRYKWIYNM